MTISFFNVNTFKSSTSIGFGVSIVTTVSDPFCTRLAVLAIPSSIVTDVGAPTITAFFNVNVVEVPLALIEAFACTGLDKLNTILTNGTGASFLVTQ